MTIKTLHIHSRRIRHTAAKYGDTSENMPAEALMMSHVLKGWRWREAVFYGRVHGTMTPSVR